MKVVSKIQNEHWDKTQGALHTVKLRPVVGTSDENKAFYASTPAGEISFDTINQAAADQLVLGGEYYVDLTPA